MLKYSDRCTALNYTEETPPYVALEGWYDIDSATVFNLLSTIDKLRSTLRANVLRLQTIEEEPFLVSLLLRVYHLGETHVHGVCRSVKLTSPRDASEDFGILNFGQLFRAEIDEEGGHEASGLALGYDENVLLDSIFIKLQNGLFNYCQPFHNPTSDEHPGLDCKVEYTNANQGIMPDAHDIWVQYTQSEENDLDNTVQGQVPSSPVLYSHWTPRNHILQFQEPLPAGKALSTFANKCKKTQHWVIHPQAQEYAVVNRTKYNDLHGWADCVDRFIRVVK